MFVDGIIQRFARCSAEFEHRLRTVAPAQWALPTPCTEWDVRTLVSHVTRGNLNYVRLLEGGTAEDFLRLREVDALGADPHGAYTRSVRACVEAFGSPGALGRELDYPLGRVTGGQALAVRTADNTIHTWDLARALGGDEELDADLVGWLADNLDSIYAGLTETPVDPGSSHRFFAAPPGVLAGSSRQDRLLHLMGRT